MRAFRSAGSILKRLTAGSSAAAEEAKVKVEYDISPLHPKHVIRFCIHPEDEEKTKKMVAGNPSRIMEWLANVNIIAARGDLLWKSGKGLFKVKEGGVKEAVKEAMKIEACCFRPQNEQLFASLIQQSEENGARLERVELLAEHIAKHGLRKGSPPPPLRPPAPSKQEANGNSNGKKGKGNGNGDGDGNGKGGGNGKGDGDGKGGGDGNGNSNGYGYGNGNGNGGPPAENGTLPEPFECPF